MPRALSPLDDHLAAPRGRGRLAGAPHTGAAGGAACGDLVRVSIRVEDDRVADAGFDAHGCAAAHAAGSAIVELALGRPLFDAARISPREVADALGGLSPARMHAAELAADAFHAALGAAAAGSARIPPSPDRTLVAMSGGVDSAVAAWLAREAGHETVAVTLKLWDDPETDGTASCCSPQAVRVARSLAHRMGLPHLTLDVRERFAASVVGNFVTEHAAGRTPNPCVRCNGLVRFDAMLALAERIGAARLATGHYARIAVEPEGPLVRSAVDSRKDQAYMLARLGSDELERLWFPLGELEKPRVREIARGARLPVADKPESQDLCFLAGTSATRFLERRGLGASRGQVVDLDGRVLGEHAGHHRFTVGQRRGIGVAAREPLYVVAKEAARNRVAVGPRAALGTDRVDVHNAVLHRAGERVDRVKLRYRSAPVGCRIEGDPGPGPHDRLQLTLDEPVHGVAPGQTACLMDGDRVVGWATIAGREKRNPASAPARELVHAH